MAAFAPSELEKTTSGAAAGPVKAVARVDAVDRRGGHAGAPQFLARRLRSGDGAIGGARACGNRRVPDRRRAATADFSAGVNAGVRGECLRERAVRRRARPPPRPRRCARAGRVPSVRRQAPRRRCRKRSIRCVRSRLARIRASSTTSVSAIRRPSRSAPEARPKSVGSACHSDCQAPAGRCCPAAIACVSVIR